MRTIGEIEDFLNKLAAEGGLFLQSSEGLFRHFCARFSGKTTKECFNAPVADLRSSLGGFEGQIPDPAAPDPNVKERNDSEYIRWFQRKMLWLEKTPKESLAKLFEEAMKDLRTIAANVAKCEAALTHKRSPQLALPSELAATSTRRLRP